MTATRILVNLSEPSQAERVAALDVDGVGLLRAELMVLEALGGVHPRALLEQGRGDEFVDRMAASLGVFASSFGSRPITYRTIDFRTNEFRGLEGGDRFEPVEDNPMIGYRGASRYVQEPDLFRLELSAIARVWNDGHSNLHVMLPFVRVPAEVESCCEILRDVGLLGRPGFELWVMAEVPSVLFHLERYARLGVVGISIGSNDLTQLLLGVDRDSEVLAKLFDERDAAVRRVHRPADRAGARAGSVHLDLRPGTFRPPGVRRAPRPRRHRCDLRQRRRARPGSHADRPCRAARRPRERPAPELSIPFPHAPEESACLPNHPKVPASRSTASGGSGAPRCVPPQTASSA